MKFENTEIFNFEGAFRGMRNPKNSWDKSDSIFGLVNIEYCEDDYDVVQLWAREELHYEDIENKECDIDKINDYVNKKDEWLIKNGILRSSCDVADVADVAFIGPKDMDLAKRLIAGGPEHRKFLRQIMVSVDITAPLYFFKEFDTYKVGTTANSTSTMHKITSKPITIDCFEIDDYRNELKVCDADKKEYSLDSVTYEMIDFLERLRLKYLETKDIRYWKELIRWLPESWLQTRTVTMTYENIFNMRRQRRNHKLTEWHKFYDWTEELPYSEDLL